MENHASNTVSNEDSVSDCHYRAYSSQDSNWRELDFKEYFMAILGVKASKKEETQSSL